MSIEAEQKTFLLADAGFAAVCGDRLYPVTIPQTASLPAVSYQSVGGPSGERNHDGPGIRQARLQYTCTADDYADAKAAAAAIRTALWGYTGAMGAITIEDCEVTADIDGYNQPSAKQTVRLDAIYLYFD
jgi:hypothetical protein